MAKKYKGPDSSLVKRRGGNVDSSKREKVKQLFFCSSEPTVKFQKKMLKQRGTKQATTTTDTG